jgi:hypothetical protein
MRLTNAFLLAFLFGLCVLSAPGCDSSNDGTVAPRTEDEIEAYEADAYAAEEEEDAAAAADENE